jgi:DNA replication protein DnaC
MIIQNGINDVCEVCNEETTEMIGIYKFHRSCLCMRNFSEICHIENEKKRLEQEKIRLEQEKINNERQQIENEKKRLEERLNRFVSYGFSSEMIDFTFENSKLEYVQICKKYAENSEKMFNDGSGLLLYGEVGTGKTHLSVTIAAHIFEEYSIHFSNLQNLFVSYYAKSFEEREYWLKKYVNCDFLIIDDFGVENLTDSYYQILFSIINGRILANRPIILTTNQSLEAFKGNASVKESRLNSRILEVCYPVKVHGKNWRQEKSKERHKAMSDFLKPKNERGCQD